MDVATTNSISPLLKSYIENPQVSPMQVFKNTDYSYIKKKLCSETDILEKLNADKLEKTQKSDANTKNIILASSIGLFMLLFGIFFKKNKNVNLLQKNLEKLYQNIPAYRGAKIIKNDEKIETLPEGIYLKISQLLGGRDKYEYIKKKSNLFLRDIIIFDKSANPIKRVLRAKDDNRSFCATMEDFTGKLEVDKILRQSPKVFIKDKESIIRKEEEKIFIYTKNFVNIYFDGRARYCTWKNKRADLIKVVNLKDLSKWEQKIFEQFNV